MKKRWQAKRKEEGKPFDKPNIIFGHNAQVAIEKFARYFDVEARLVPVSHESCYCLDIDRAVTMVDENTIGVIVILGSTYTGHFEDVERMARELDKIQKEKGWDIPIHVDAASGGFVAPFAFPDLKWGFEIKRVVSINSSGHKFGLAYAGIGWVLWRDEQYLSKELIFELHYLGGKEQTYTLNFSRPACFMISQYYNFVRLGEQGYTCIALTDLENARLLSWALERSEYFDVVSDIHRTRGLTFATSTGNKQSEGDQNQNTDSKPSKQKMSEITKDGEEEEWIADREEAAKYNPGLPVVAFKLRDDVKKESPLISERGVSLLLRTRGWIVPSYELPRDCHEINILRVVVRESMTQDLVAKLVQDLMWTVETLLDGTVDAVTVALATQASKKEEEEKAAPLPGDLRSEEERKSEKGGKMKAIFPEADNPNKLDIPPTLKAQTFNSQC
eukprot:TRINITY_DN5440_c0_g2_i1.p1 TRINITY_DN5440_c0_g2~~TRINITY_DN5440_c0_g2_i1.p1  ORF type:complete len:446 (+),score=116.29 TRINITY_DN5440_c0_g2_i1:573-1910(+)